MRNKQTKGRQPQHRFCPQAAPWSPRDSPPHSECGSSPAQSPADPSALKLELLAVLHEDIPDIFKTKLHAALGDNLSTIKLELEAVKTL